MREHIRGVEDLARLRGRIHDGLTASGVGQADRDAFVIAVHEAAAAALEEFAADGAATGGPANVLVIWSRQSGRREQLVAEVRANGPAPARHDATSLRGVIVGKVSDAYSVTTLIGGGVTRVVRNIENSEPGSS